MEDLQQKPKSPSPEPKEETTIEIGVFSRLNPFQTDHLFWYYQDDNQLRQGPFSSIQMDTWLASNYLPPELQIAYQKAESPTDFVTLKEFSDTPSIFVSKRFEKPIEEEKDEIRVSTPVKKRKRGLNLDSESWTPRPVALEEKELLEEMLELPPKIYLEFDDPSHYTPNFLQEDVEQAPQGVSVPKTGEFSVN